MTPSGTETRLRYRKRERQKEREKGEHRYKSWIFGTLCCLPLAGIMDWPCSQCVCLCVCFCLTARMYVGVCCQKVLRGDVAFVSGRSAGAWKQGMATAPTPTTLKPNLLCWDIKTATSRQSNLTQVRPDETHSNMCLLKSSCTALPPNGCGHKICFFPRCYTPRLFQHLHQMEVKLVNYLPEDIKAGWA